MRAERHYEPAYGLYISRLVPGDHRKTMHKLLLTPSLALCPPLGLFVAARDSQHPFTFVRAGSPMAAFLPTG